MREMKKMTKTTKNNLITYGMVILLFVIMQVMVSTGNVSSLLTGLLVPLCAYIILAVSLNLTGFMCVGAFTSAFFSKCMADTIPVSGLRYFLALLIGAAAAGICGILIGIPVLRLKGDYLAIVTLAFGEIIKNIVNILFIERKKNNFIYSFYRKRRKRISFFHHRCPLLRASAGRGSHCKRSPGDYGDAERFHIFYQCDSDPDYPVYRIEPDSFQKRPGDYVYPRQPDCSGIGGDQYHEI